MAWIDSALSAWRFAGRSLTRYRPAENTKILLVTADCVLESDDAMTSLAPASWTRTAHSGQIRMPNGETVPAGVMSFARQQGDSGFFVMSTPSVWRAAGVPGGPLGLERLMTAVLLHEATHLSQTSTYMAAMSRIGERWKLPESFNDDSIQERFEANAAFAQSMQKETELLFAAADAVDDAEARRLAAQAMTLMKVRRATWFTGADAGLSDAEDVFQTLEGSGQWVGFGWLIAADGAARPRAEAMAGFARRGGWWSQTHGLALLLALERIAGDSWRADVFGDGKRSSIALLQAALAAPPSPLADH